jgi:uncharacterized protein YgbK (DUF1537 family)
VPKLLVIADDLSGATDVGVQFASQGIRAFVTILAPDERSNLAGLFESHDVVLIDIESRHLSPDEGRRRVRMAVEETRAAGVEFFYKKTDSTLRGNIGAELDALLKATAERTLCFIPAHPALGRTTRDGVHFVHGRPLHQSAFAVDPRNPITESQVVAILARQTDLPISLVHQVDLSAFRKEPAPGVVVFDAETEAELKHAAEAVRDAGCLKVLAGPAAFASRLSELIPFAREALVRPRVPSRLLVLNGSLNEVALRQCDVARENGFASVALTPEALLAENKAGDDVRASIVKKTASLLAGGRDVLLGSVSSREECSLFNSEGMKFLSSEPGNWPERIALNTGRIVERILSSQPSNHQATQLNLALVVFGGDTLAGITRANSWKGFLPRYEPLPGVALSEVFDNHLVVISKPGGFGSDDVLLKLRALSAP